MLETLEKTEALPMEQPFVQRDNQQVSLAKLGWLAGIVDGEGSICLLRRQHKSTPNQNGFNPKVSVVNTDLVIVNEIIEILRSLELAHHVQKKSGNKRWKDRYDISITGFLRVRRFLSVFTEYLVGKKDRATLVTKYIDLRLSKPTRAEIGSAERTIFEQVSELNSRGPKTSTTLRSPVEIH